MDSERRRSELLNLLQNSPEPVKGADLAKHFNISRQAIVQDIAILRASGETIISSLQGYMLPPEPQNKWIESIIACNHTRAQIEEELSIIVNLGGQIVDVIIEHPVYGEMWGSLMISSLRDLKLFIHTLRETEANPLLTLTGGIHLHTIKAPDETVIAEIKKSLQSEGFLIK